MHTALRVSVFDARPFDKSQSFFGPLGHHFASGIGAYYDVPLPFDRHGNVYMHGVMLIAVFFGCFTVGLAVAARRPALAAVLLLLWSAWPMTLLTGPGDLARGAFVLGGVLLMLVAVRPSPGNRIGLVLILAAGLVAVSLGVSTSSAVAKGELLNWQSWDFYTQPDTPVGVSYVWDMSLDGFSYPKKVTTVFRVKGPKTPHYWRATILDSFYNGAWYEGEIPPVLPASKNGRDVVTNDPFLPAAARNPKHWVKQEVTMAALRDDRLVAATTPVAYDKGDLDSVSYGEAGTATSQAELTHDQSYTVWSYAPQPTPQELEASKPIYPAGVQRFLELSPNTTAKPYGTPGGRRDPARAGRARRGHGVLPADLPRGATRRRRRDQSVRGDRRHRGVVPLQPGLHLQPAPAPRSRGAGPRLVRDDREDRLLPVLRGGDGGDAALARHPPRGSPPDSSPASTTPRSTSGR